MSSFASFVCLVGAATVAQGPTVVATPHAGAGAGWRAESIHRSDGGIWYAHVDKVVDHYGANEILCTDDKGRLLLLSVYSAQWTSNSVVCDGQWLAPTRSADVDPRIPGREIYAAGRSGSIHRAVLRPQPFARFSFESVEIGHAAGEEFHAILAEDLIPGGNVELIAFAITGAVYELLPAGPAGQPGNGDPFTMRKVGTVPGRVRDVVVVRGAGADGATMLGVSRSGDLLAMRLANGALRHEVVVHEDCGLGRIAAAKGRPGVHYVTRDDGVVVRVAKDADGQLQRDVIFAGGQGLRGVASGRFFSDDREALAVYGYDKTVHLISRQTGGPWQADTMLTTEQKGHWLAVGELDGRNGTDELVATGFDGEVVLLARPAGYGLPGAAVPAIERAVVPATPLAKPAPGAVITAAPGEALRVAARLGGRALSELSALRYHGGFETKSLAFETLVRIGANGRIVPGLASAWRRENDDKVFVFTLRDGATWHDGKPVTAADVALHCRRWVGLPEHDWLRSNARIVAVRATGPRELRVELDRPAALLADLCAINPTAAMAPASWSREGEFQAPVGSGPFVCLGAKDGAGARILRYRQAGGRSLVDLVGIDGDPLDALLRGDVDAVVGSWLVGIEPRRAAALQKDPRFTVVDAPGSAMWHLTLRWERGPLADVARRRAVAAAVDRAELVRVAAAGLGDPSTAWAAPAFADWPQGRKVETPGAVTATLAAAPATAAPLRLAPGDGDALLVATLAGQLRRAGLAVDVLADDPKEWDLRLERTHGAPYDPFTVVERFGRPASQPTAATPKDVTIDEPLAAAIDGLLAASDETTWPQHFARIQARLDEVLPVVPLFAPRRLAVVANGVAPPALDLDLYRLDPAWLAKPR